MAMMGQALHDTRRAMDHYVMYVYDDDGQDSGVLPTARC
jgi:hypothetical protein